jgi:hypothetical protein
MGVSVGGSYRTYSAPIKSKNTLGFLQPANLGQFSINKPISVQLQTKVQGVNNEGIPNPTTYAVVSGELPSGVTLSSSGLLSGTIPDVPEGASYNFTVEAYRELFGHWVRGSIAFTITVTRASNSLIYSLPLNGNLTPAVGSGIGYIGSGGYQTFTKADLSGPSTKKMLNAGTRNLNNNRTTKIQIGSEFVFMRESNFTIEFFFSSYGQPYDPVAANYPIFQINNALQLRWSFHDYYSQPDYYGSRSLSVRNFYDTTTGKSKEFYADATTSVGNYGHRPYNHIAMVRNNDQFRVYINGSSAGYGPTPVYPTHPYNTIDIATTVPFIEFANGSFCDFRIYDYAKYTGNTITVPNDLDDIYNPY